MKNRIKKLRRELCLSQREFSERVGVKRNTIATYESGVRTPLNSVILNICREYNVNETWLRTGEGSMFSPPPQNRMDKHGSAITTTDSWVLMEVELPAYVDSKFINTLAQLSPGEIARLKRYANALLQAKEKLKESH